MDNCARCTHALCGYAEGYSSKECGMSGPRGFSYIEDCKLERDEFFSGAEDCPDFEEYFPDYD